jgi:hypothetical protein
MISIESLDRMEQLTKHLELERFRESIQDIVDCLEDEGFCLEEVKQFLQLELNELLGDQ